MRSIALLLMGLGLGAGLSGCGSELPPPPAIVEPTLNASPDINPDPGGRPSSVIVRIHPIGAAGTFETADYFQLYEKKGTMPGADFVGREQVAPARGDGKNRILELKARAKLPSIVAAFCIIDRAQWRAEARNPPNKTTKPAVAVDGLALTVANAGS